MKRFFKSIDEKLFDRGFCKCDEPENKHGVCYVRTTKQGYRQRLDILYKAYGRCLIQSYQEGVNSDGFNNMVGLSYEETKLAMKKYRQLKRKYKW